MRKISLENISLKKLRNRELIKEFPEFYVLEKCIENFPPWHYNESVYEHTISVLEEFEKIFERKDKFLQTYLNDKPENHYSKKDLLFLMGMHHDIAKPETIILDGKYTSCPNHEKDSANKSKKILERFSLLKEEKERIIQMISCHGIFCITAHEENPKKDYKILKNTYPDIFLDMILFELADTKAIKINKENKTKLTGMIEFYENMIVKELY